MTFRRFLLLRVIRLYPLVVLGAALGGMLHIALAPAGDVPFLIRLILHGSLLIPEFPQNPIDPSFLPIDPPAWSLFFEMIASLLFGLGVWRARFRLSAILTLLSALILLIVVERHASFDVGWSSTAIHAGLARVVFGFGLGVFIYRFHREQRWLRLSIPFGLGATLLSVVLLLPVSSKWLQLACVFILFPILIFGVSQERSPSHPALCRLSGDISYPLYILHWPIYRWIGAAAASLGIVGNSWIMAMVAPAVAIAASILMLRLYDEPVRRSLSLRLSGRSAAAPRLAPAHPVDVP
jgi:peptidoglycan/LPS O-acetylase OafA/YrhL